MREMYAGVVSVCNEGGSVCAVVCVCVGGGIEENVRKTGGGGSRRRECKE